MLEIRARAKSQSIIGVDLTTPKKEKSIDTYKRELSERTQSAGRKVMFMIDDQVVPINQDSLSSKVTSFEDEDEDDNVEVVIDAGDKGEFYLDELE